MRVRSVVVTIGLPLLLVGLAAAGPTPGNDAGNGPQRRAQAGPKIYISADMEGLAAAVSAEQLGPGGFEYTAYRRIMTEEVLAAIEGARAAGAGQIMVSDSHGNGQNIIPDMLPDDVLLVRSWPRPLMMMEGIDETFDGAIFIGYHSGTTNPEGVRAHTMSSSNLTDVRLNGRSMNEAGINACIAGHFGVPVIMISGDDASVAETRALVGEVEPAVVKYAISYHAATVMTPNRAREVIREAARRAVERIDDFEPMKADYPVTMEVRFKHYQPGQLLAYLPLFERVDAHAVRCTVEDMCVASRVLEFILNYRVDITP